MGYGPKTLPPHPNVYKNFDAISPQTAAYYCVVSSRLHSCLGSIPVPKRTHVTSPTSTNLVALPIPVGPKLSHSIVRVMAMGPQDFEMTLGGFYEQ